jgi:DNA-binding NtrC family response regulator
MASQINKRVLLVDDEEDFCDLVTRILYKEGYEVRCTTTLESANLALKEYDPAIVLLDQELPDGRGLHFLEENQEILNHKQVIFITGHTSRTIIDQAISLGAFHFLSKPFSSSTLSRAVNQAETFH